MQSKPMHRCIAHIFINIQSIYVSWLGVYTSTKLVVSMYIFSACRTAVISCFCVVIYFIFIYLRIIFFLLVTQLAYYLRAISPIVLGYSSAHFNIFLSFLLPSFRWLSAFVLFLLVIHHSPSWSFIASSSNSVFLKLLKEWKSKKSHHFGRAKIYYEWTMFCIIAFS